MVRSCMLMLAALLLMQQAVGYPHYWVFPEHSSEGPAPASPPTCSALPTRGWAAHPDVVADPKVTYTVLQNAKPMTKVCPGVKYTVQVGFPLPRYAMLVATNAVFTKTYLGLDPEIDKREKPCPNRIILDSLTNQDTPSMASKLSAGFTVNCGAAGKVTFSSSSSAFGNDAFHEATGSIPIDASCALATCPKSTTPTTTATPPTTTPAVKPTTTPSTTPSTGGKTPGTKEVETEDEGTDDGEHHGGKGSDSGEDSSGGRGRGRGGRDDGEGDDADSGSSGAPTGSSSSGTKGTGSGTTGTGTTGTGTDTGLVITATSTNKGAAATAASAAASAGILAASGQCKLKVQTAPSTCTKSELGYSCAQTNTKLNGMKVHWQLGGCVPDNVCTKTYQVKNNETTVNAEMLHMAVEMPTNGYVGLAFASSPARMANSDGIIGWVALNGTPKIESYPIRGQAVAASSANTGSNQFLSHASTSTVNGITTICFSRPLSHPGAKFSQTLSPDTPLKLIYARGGSKGLVNHNAEGGLELNMKTATLTNAKRSWWLEIHGILLATAWAVLVPMGIMSSRRRGVFGGKQSAGTDTWFNFHRLFTLLGVAAFGAGLAIGFMKLDEGPGQVGSVHTKLAVALIGSSVLQIILGICRLPKTHQHRMLWENSHHFLGYLTVAAGLANVFIGAKLYHDKTGRSILPWVIAVAGMIGAWVVLDALLWSRFGKRKEQEGVVYQGAEGNGKVMPPPHAHDVSGMRRADQAV